MGCSHLPPLLPLVSVLGGDGDVDNNDNDNSSLFFFVLLRSSTFSSLMMGCAHLPPLLPLVSVVDGDGDVANNDDDNYDNSSSFFVLLLSFSASFSLCDVHTFHHFSHSSVYSAVMEM